MNNQVHHDRRHDILLVGATGFTGSLIAEYLYRRCAGSGIQLTLAGRDIERLADLRDRLIREAPGRSAESGADTTAVLAELAVLTVDLLDEESVDAAARESTVVLSAAGPYSRLGSGLVAACVRHGTKYVDLTGEVHWMRRMIDTHEAAAVSNGACIVHCCGFDSVPSDLGVLAAQDEMLRRYGRVPETIRFVAEEIDGGLSGGTIASLCALIDDARRDPVTRAALKDPDSLAPVPEGRPATGRASGSSGLPRFDPLLGKWTVPFFMGAINERVVRRSNALRDFPLGTDPDYREVIPFRPGARGMFTASAVWLGSLLVMGLVSFVPTRRLLEATVLPKPGHGPRIARERRGSFRVKLVATTGSAEQRVTVTISADRDAGYGATAVMVGECSILLLELARNGRPPRGFQTPASAFGQALVSRLREAGIRFDVTG